MSGDSSLPPYAEKYFEEKFNNVTQQNEFTNRSIKNFRGEFTAYKKEVKNRLDEIDHKVEENKKKMEEYHDLHPSTQEFVKNGSLNWKAPVDIGTFFSGISIGTFFWIKETREFAVQAVGWFLQIPRP